MPSARHTWPLTAALVVGTLAPHPALWALLTAAGALYGLACLTTYTKD